MMMFSINPAYDYQKGEYGIGEVDQRMDLYRRCEKEGIGISVMKAFAAGQLLNEKTSPFGKALTEYQCIQYALDKPGVITVLPGIRNCEDLERILGFFKATPEERDYSVIGSFAPQSAEGTCVYCNHCQPCPKGLNVGLINKYYDSIKNRTPAPVPPENLRIQALLLRFSMNRKKLWKSILFGYLIFFIYSDRLEEEKNRP